MRKLRINRALHARALLCAEAIAEPLTEFIRCCVVNHSRGALAGVAVPEDMLSATREGVVISFPDPSPGDPPELIRRAIAAGTLYAESRRAAPFKTDLVCGKHYLVEEEP